MRHKVAIIVFCLPILLIISMVSELQSEPLKPKMIYPIVLDPGHGGDKKFPYEEFGDKYDSISGKYLEHFKNGAAYKDRTEREITLQIAKEVKKILDLTKTESGFKTFKKYIKYFSKEEPVWISFNTMLSREDNYTDRKEPENGDINAPYRLYDSIDKKTRKVIPGRLSRINAFQPYLVVSIHINDDAFIKPENTKKIEGGMAAVLAPSYSTFIKLKKISEKKMDPSEFLNTHWKNWMIFDGSQSRLENAIIDAWIYFNGYWPDRKNKKANLAKFEGYRQNMVSWAYKDIPGWEKLGSMDIEGPYAKTHSLFKATGKFWDRERGKAEKMKREDGPEGFGGDNHYAAKEIIRFIQYGVREQKKRMDEKIPPIPPITKPYISTYSVPTFINAVSAFLELGDIKRDMDMNLLLKNKKETAISMAVGIYSLFSGMKITIKGYPYHPKGKSINFKKYEKINGRNYFQEAVQILE